MQPEEKCCLKAPSRLSLALKCGAILLLFIMSITVVACGAATNAAQDTIGGPQVTVTISFDNKSPIPTPPAYTCSVWVTQSTPAFHPGDRISVNMKYVRNVDGNPVGVAGATASATIMWADGFPTALQPVQTSSDGLAVTYFEVPNRPAIVNRNNTVSVVFTAPDGNTCTVDKDRAGFFTIIMVSPTAVPSPSATPTPTPEP